MITITAVDMPTNGSLVLGLWSLVAIWHFSYILNVPAFFLPTLYIQKRVSTKYPISQLVFNFIYNILVLLGRAQLHFYTCKPHH